MNVQRVTEREPASMKQTDKGSRIVRASLKTLKCILFLKTIIINNSLSNKVICFTMSVLVVPYKINVKRSSRMVIACMRVSFVAVSALNAPTHETHADIAEGHITYQSLV